MKVNFETPLNIGDIIYKYANCKELIEYKIVGIQIHSVYYKDGYNENVIHYRTIPSTWKKAYANPESSNVFYTIDGKELGINYFKSKEELIKTIINIIV